MSSIDPTYTLGKLAASKDALMAALSAEGLLRANAAQSLAPVPLRVGLVTSIGSAAHADISTVFERAGMAFTVVEVDTPVQGSGAEVPVAAAIRAADDAGVDVLLVARGGGSKTDLATFDHEVVARAIAAGGGACRYRHRPRHRPQRRRRGCAYCHHNSNRGCTVRCRAGRGMGLTG